MTLIDGVGGREFQAKAIGVRRRQGFRNRIKRPQVKGLPSSGLHTRNRERTSARAAMVGARDPTQRQRLIAMLTECRYGPGFLLWRLPDDLIHTRGPGSPGE